MICMALLSTAWHFLEASVTLCHPSCSSCSVWSSLSCCVRLATWKLDRLTSLPFSCVKIVVISCCCIVIYWIGMWKPVGNSGNLILMASRWIHPQSLASSSAFCRRSSSLSARSSWYAMDCRGVCDQLCPAYCSNTTPRYSKIKSCLLNINTCQDCQGNIRVSAPCRRRFQKKNIRLLWSIVNGLV